MVAPRGQRAAPLSKTASPQTEQQLLSLCIAGCWLARQLLVFALLVVTEGFLGKASATKLFFFPGGRSGEQSGRGRSGWGAGGGQGRTHAVERQRLSNGGGPGAPPPAQALLLLLICRPHPHPRHLLHCCHRPRRHQSVGASRCHAHSCWRQDAGQVPAGRLPSAPRPKKRIPGSVDGNAFN